MKKNTLLFLMLFFQSFYLFSSESERLKGLHTLNSLILKRGLQGSVQHIRTKHGSLNFDLRSGRNFFHAVVASNHVDFAQECIRQGAITTLRDRSGRTAFEYARTPEMKEIFYKEALDFYLDTTIN